MNQGQESKKRRWRRKEKPSTVYNIPLAFGLVLHVKKSANAWWMDQQKVHKLIAAFSIGSTIPEACSYAEISLRQYKYFVKEYPIFAEARKGYVSKLGILAKMTVVKAINAGDLKTAWKWLEKKIPEEFGRPSRIGRRRKRFMSEEERKKLHTQSVEDPHDQMSQEEKDALARFSAERRARIEKESDELP